MPIKLRFNPRLRSMVRWYTMALAIGVDVQAVARCANTAGTSRCDRRCAHCAAPLHRRFEPHSIQCIEYGVAPSTNPATNWPRALSNDTCGYLVGTTNWRTNINHDTWDVGYEAAQLGNPGLSLTSCAHLCSSDTTCYAWCAAGTWLTACLSYSTHPPAHTLAYVAAQDVGVDSWK